MAHSVYKKTATKAKNGKIFAFGRNDDMHGKDKSLGGYSVWVVCENYAGNVHGGIAKTWRYVGIDMSFYEAVKLMNHKLGYNGFEV